MKKAATHAQIPMQDVGPLLLKGLVSGEITVPLATFETPLFPSVNRGAKLSRLCGGIAVTLIGEKMTRSVALEAPTAAESFEMIEKIKARLPELQALTAKNSRFAKLLDIHAQLAGRLFFLRFAFTTGDASGHNMVTQASEALMLWMLEQYPTLRYISLSGNVCTDKKVSSVNAILGRGKSVIAELIIPRALCEKHLHASPEAIAELHVKKNLLGSITAGSLHSANAHFANMLLAFYLATGQDAANIVEGSQGMVHSEATLDGLYFSVTLPNIIVGSVGNGKDLPFVADNLEKLGCLEARNPGDNARRLAGIAAAVVLCGELSLLAALTNPTELMRTHRLMERTKGKSNK